MLKGGGRRGGANGLTPKLQRWCSQLALSSERPGGQGAKRKHRMGCEPVFAGARPARPQAVSPYGSVLGQRLGPLELRAAWEQSPWCAAPASAEGARRPALCATRSRLISTLRGAALVQRQKDLSAYNWNSFGLRYGRRQAGSAPGRRPGTRDFQPRTDRASGHAGPQRGPGNGRGPGVSVLNQ